MAEIKKVPAIRFKGFSEDWEGDNFGNRLNIENGYAFKSIYFQDETTRLIVLTPGNVHIGGGFQKDKGRYYSEAGEIPSRFILEPDDIFVTMTDLTPTAQTLGYPAVVPNDGNTYLLNQRLGKLVNFEGDKNFLLQILSTEKNHKQIVLSATGTTVKHSSPQKILSFLNHFPSRNEQTQIGSYFQHLDKLISLHQAKVNKLTNLKKAMLEKMFPKQGADVPEIRFKGFAGAWEEKRLGDIVEFFSGLTYSPKDVVDSDGTFVLRSSNVKNGEIVNADDVFVNSEVVNCDNVREGDIAVVVRNGSRSLIGKHAQIKSKMNNTVIGAFMTGIRSEQSNFTNVLLDTEQFNKEVEKNLGATINQITTGAFKKMQFSFPDPTEQTQIGCYFQNLDKLITLHQTELEKLNNLKKACLEKMFV